MKDMHSIIKRPITTEKSTIGKNTSNRVVFEVDLKANKNQIKQSIEKIFKVHVEAVNTSIVRGKIKRVGRNEGKRPNWKKATVKIREGEKIQIFEGV